MRVGYEGLSVSVVRGLENVPRMMLFPGAFSPLSLSRSSDATTHENAGDDGKGPHAAFSIFSSPQLNSPSQPFDLHENVTA
jgi:hypothetical protein